MRTSQHFNTGPGFPQNRVDVNLLFAAHPHNDDHPLWKMAEQCGVDPAEDGVCLACYAYVLLNTPKPATDWEAIAREAFSWWDAWYSVFPEYRGGKEPEAYERVKAALG